MLMVYRGIRDLSLDLSDTSSFNLLYTDIILNILIKEVIKNCEYRADEIHSKLDVENQFPI